MIEKVLNAAERLKGVVVHTALSEHDSISEQFQCKVAFKREDTQNVRSYKIRGAYNKIATLSEEQRNNGVVCCSAGNHAQGVALSCAKLKVQGVIYMPAPTPKQKVNQVRLFGKSWVDVRLIGDTFDDALVHANDYKTNGGATFIHPFDDELVIAGQGTVGKEIIEDASDNVDFVFLPIGGGGLAAGVASYIKKVSPETKIIGVEPKGAASMTAAFNADGPVELESIDRFIDGAAVKKVGNLNYKLCKELLDDCISVDEGAVCSWMIKLYNEQAIVVEPAGALSLAGLEKYKERIGGKSVVCVLSGSNNDIDRMPEIKERSLIYEGLKHYFIIQFPQRSGALKEFVGEVLGPDDDITRFEYIKRSAKQAGPALVGIELKRKDDFNNLLERMETHSINYRMVNSDPNLFEYFL